MRGVSCVQDQCRKHCGGSVISVHVVMATWTDWQASVVPITLRDLASERSLALRVLAAEAALDRTVTWVHVSELDDPTPFLEGGELLLSTGLVIDDATDFPAFVARLAGCGVAALGFGTGLRHESVPTGLLRAASEAGLPLLEVPRRTPFIAISKVVSAALAADAYAEVTTTNSAQQALTRAALRAGRSGVIRKLAQLLGAWVLLVEESGRLVHASPASAARRLTAVASEIERVRSRQGPVSATFTAESDRVSVQALSSRPRTYLVVGRPERLGRTDQHVLNSCASLLTVAMARSQSLTTAQRSLRTGVLRLFLAGATEDALTCASDAWGPPPEEPVRVIAGSGPPAARASLLDLLESEADDIGFFGGLDDHVVLVTADGGQGDNHLRRLARTHETMHFGVSEPAEYGAADKAYGQALHAVESAERSGVPVMRFADIAGSGLLGVVRPAEAQAFAESLLGPLRRHDERGRGDLVVSLREWLAHHGQWDPAAARLGVHRHTLRNRMSKVAELLDVDLDSPGTRAELWLTLQLLGPG